MTRTAEFVATLLAGATGAAIAAVAVGATLLVVVPAMLGVGTVALVGRRRP